MKRVPQHEILDGDTESPEAVVESLGDLRRVNRWLGGVDTTVFLLRRAMKKLGLRAASVLETAAGDGYSISLAAERLRQEKLEVEVVCLDRRGLNGQVHCCKRTVVGNALALEFPPESFDFVSCGLFIHHLTPDQVITFVNGALKVARRAVLINDLRRSALHLALVHGVAPLFRSPISRNDSVASVKQAYTPQELAGLLRQTRAARFEIQKRYLFRMGVTVWK